MPPTNNTVYVLTTMQGVEEILEYHVSGAKYILQPPKYRNINANCVNYTDNLRHQDLNYLLGSYKFGLQASINPRGFSI